MASNYTVPDSPVSPAQKVVDISYNDQIYVYRSDAQFSTQTTILGSNSKQNDVKIVPYSSATANPGKIILRPSSDAYSPDVYVGTPYSSLNINNLLFRYKSSSYTSGNWAPSNGSIGSLSGSFSTATINGQQLIKLTSGQSITSSLNSFYGRNVFGFLVFLLRPQSGAYSSFANKNLNLFKFYNSGASFSEPSLSLGSNMYNFNFTTVNSRDITTSSSFYGPISVSSSNNIVNSAASYSPFLLKKPYTQTSSDLILLVDFHYFSDSSSRNFYSSVNGKQSFVSKTFSNLDSREIFQNLNQQSSNYTLKLEAAQSAGNLIDVYLADICFYSFDDSIKFATSEVTNFINSVKNSLAWDNKNILTQSSTGKRQVSFSSNSANNIGFDYSYDFINIIGKKGS